MELRNNLFRSENKATQPGKILKIFSSLIIEGEEISRLRKEKVTLFNQDFQLNFLWKFLANDKSLKV